MTEEQTDRIKPTVDGEAALAHLSQWGATAAEFMSSNMGGFPDWRDKITQWVTASLEQLVDPDDRLQKLVNTLFAAKTLSTKAGEDFQKVVAQLIGVTDLTSHVNGLESILPDMEISSSSEATGKILAAVSWALGHLSFNSTDHMSMVRSFRTMINDPGRYKPAMPTREELLRDARLILEEAIETINAMGMRVISGEDHELEVYDYGDQPNLAKIIDGCCDSRYVATWAMVTCGVMDRPIQEAVDENNQLKAEHGHRNPETGKWEKPEGHVPPDIEGLIEQQVKALSLQ